MRQVTELGSEALVVGASVGKREDIDRMYKEVTDKWGRVDVLVNNAGACMWMHASARGRDRYFELAQGTGACAV